MCGGKAEKLGDVHIKEVSVKNGEILVESHGASDICCSSGGNRVGADVFWIMCVKETMVALYFIVLRGWNTSRQHKVTHKIDAYIKGMQAAANDQVLKD